MALTAHCDPVPLTEDERKQLLKLRDLRDVPHAYLSAEDWDWLMTLAERGLHLSATIRHVTTEGGLSPQ